MAIYFFFFLFVKDDEHRSFQDDLIDNFLLRIFTS